jgi:hypothetical protein
MAKVAGICFEARLNRDTVKTCFRYNIQVDEQNSFPTPTRISTLQGYLFAIYKIICNAESDACGTP